MEQKPTSGGSNMFQGASPQLTFVFGIIAGVAATSLIVLGFSYFNPGAKKTPTASATTNTSTTTTDTGTESYGNVRAVSDSDYIRGGKNPKITFVEYSDYECPFCKSFHTTMQRLTSDYGDDVAWVYRHFPLSFHANAPKEAEAGLCVGKLGGSDKFWDFSDKIFERTTSNGYGFALTDLGPLAKEVGVDQAKFQDCLDSGEMAGQVSTDTADGTQAGATGTPTTFIVDANGNTITAIPGALPYEQVKTQVDQILSSI